MSKNFDNTQKKALEKIYAKIFDTQSTVQKNQIPDLTDEGSRLIQQTGINPNDLIHKSLEDFLMEDNVSLSHSNDNRIKITYPNIFNGTTVSSPN